MQIEALAGQPEPSGQLDDECFFVGEPTEPAILVFVHANAELPFQARPGRRYDFVGTMQAVPSNLGTLH